MSALPHSAPLSPVDETEEPRFPSPVLPGSADTLQTLASVSHPRRDSKCNEAAIDSATEQKLWIQCTLNGVKHRGEDWIEPIFTDDEPAGCSACLPDIVVVNGAVNKFSDALASKAPAPWQRILTKTEADACITNYSSRAPPEAACNMPFCDATSIPDTYLYNDKRRCTALQKFCAMFYMHLFGGSSSKLPNTEPARNFRCGLNSLRERAVILVFCVTISCIAWWRAWHFIFQLKYSIRSYPVVFGNIDTFEISCSGCKIQITNPNKKAPWAGMYYPNNTILYFPGSFEVFDNGLDCDLDKRYCRLLVSNFEKVPSTVNRKRLFSDDTIDADFYHYPTIDLIIDDDWNGTLVIINPSPETESPGSSHPTIIVPFESTSHFQIPLFPKASSDISLPSLSLTSNSQYSPIFFNGFRGGRYRNVTVKCVTGSFIARGADFVEGSVVDITLPMGDVIISADQRIETTLSSIYSATPPSLIEMAMHVVNASDDTGAPYDLHEIFVHGYHFRNDEHLIIPNGSCYLAEPHTLPGFGTLANVTFQCYFEIESSGHVSGPVLLSYFGGNLMPTGYELSFSASLGNTISIVSPSLKREKHGSPGSEQYSGCERYIEGPKNVCVAASEGASDVPPVSVATANDIFIMLPANDSAKHKPFRFISTASRSLTLGSFVYKRKDAEENPQSIQNCCTRIPYHELQHLSAAIEALRQNNTEFVIIKIQGSGSNLPGYFTLTKKRIYTVIDPYIIQTLTFRLLSIHISSITVSFGALLCPDVMVDEEITYRRIARNYEILNDFLTHTVEERDSMFLSFQFQAPLQISKAGFKFYGKGTIQYNPQLYLDSDHGEFWLLILSFYIPYILSAIISAILLAVLVRKLRDYRTILFQTTIEGHRLSRIAPFSHLAEVPRHLTDPKKHLKSKFKASLLKICSLFEIKERRPMPEHIRWACKIRGNLSSHSSLNYTKLSDSDDFAESGVKAAESGVKGSFKSYIFKSIEQKYARKVSFSQVALEKSLSQSTELDKFKTDKFIDVDFDELFFDATVTQPTGKLVLEAKSSGMGPLQPRNIYESVEVTSEDYPCDNRVRYRITNVMITDQTAESVTFTFGLYSLKGSKELKFSEPEKTIRLRFDEDTILEARVVEQTSELVLKTEFPSMGPRKIYDFVVVRSEDLQGRYCIRNVHMDNQGFTFDLYSLKDFKRLDFFEYKPNETIKLKFDDPYIIDDEFIDCLFMNNAFDHDNLVASLKRINEGGANANEKKKKSNETSRDKTEMLGQEDSAATFGAPTFETDETLRWNPFKDRIILTVAAIFLESVESYRAIVSSTGLESFCDMLIVNGSFHLREWKLLGTIDEIMDEYHQQRLPSDGMTDDYCQQETSKNGPQILHHSRIPALYQTENVGSSIGATLLPRTVPSKITCKRSDLEQRLNSDSAQYSSSVDYFHTDCSLHYSEDAVHPAGSKSIEIVAKSRALNFFEYKENPFIETHNWRSFQPGCSFEIEWDKALEEKIAIDDIRCTVNKDHSMPRIKMDLADEMVSGAGVPCYMHIQCFAALQRKIEAVSTDECEVSGTDATVYSHRLIDAYKPKGNNAFLSPICHSFACFCAICPALGLFTLWGFSANDTYLIHPYQTPAAYFCIFALVYFFIAFLYLFLAYLDFPYLFDSHIRQFSSFSKWSFWFHTFFNFSNVRLLFHAASFLVIYLDIITISLFLIWLCLGVVVRPALAIPYFTGFAVFIGNLISRAAAINNLQDTIINLTLEKFQTLLEPLIAKSMSQLDDIIGILEKFDAGIHLAEGSPFAGITRENRSLVQEKLRALRDSIASSDVRAVASSAAAIKDKGAAGLHAVQRASSAHDSDALQREVRGVGRLQLRKLKESEIVGLFSNLWSSIREELGLSSRDIISALIFSSLILGLFLSFIFIGIAIFSDGTDPFTAIVNAGLTISAGLGEQRRNQSPTSDGAKGFEVFDFYVSGFLSALESRLTKSKSAVIQIFVVMTSTETESAAIISALKEMKFGIDIICSKNDSQSDSGDSEAVKSRRE